jgi:hypothetical protein
VVTEEEYKEYINSISNEEVPSVLFNVLSIVHKQFEQKKEKMDEVQQLSYSMFKLFFKQCNTILSLSKGSKYIYLPNSEYIDLKSIYSLTRTAHELYLNFNYLFYNRVFVDFDETEEQEFKLLSYKLSGEIENKKTVEILKKFDEPHPLCEESMAGIKSRRSELLEKINNHPIYKVLPQPLKKAIKSGVWKVSIEKKLSWSDLLEYTPMSKRYGILEYHNMSKYAHTAYSSLQLEAAHDYDVDGLHCHLYILISLFSISALEISGKSIDYISKREQSLLLEFHGMANR